MAPIRSFRIRPLAMGLVLVLGVSVTTCRLDKLINPATADRLVVSPTNVDTSAHLGSSRTDTLIFQVGSADGAALPWTASKSAVWVALLDSLGTTLDTVRVVIDPPDTLAGTLLRDTIVFVSATTNGTIKVPLSVEMLAPAPELSVTPASRAKTAFVGSAVPDTFNLLIANTGALPLTWSAVADSSWITISKDSGGAPPTDTSLVTLTPGSLTVGTRTDTITVTASGGATGSPFKVPVTYTILPCAEPLMTLDTVVTGSVGLSDCVAPQRAGSHAKLYAFQANGGDTLSFRLTSSAFTPHLILTNSTGVAVLDSTDQCAPVDTACLTNFIVSPTGTGRYVIEVTTANAGETGAFTLSAVKERTPSVPSAGQFRADGTTAIGVGAVTPENTVVFKATVNDPNPQDSVRLEVELTDVTSGTQVDSTTFVPRGTPVALPVTGLTDNDAYHWRARTCDQTARCSAWFSFGGNVDPAADFFVNSVPQTPDAPNSPNQFNGVGQVAIPPGGGTGGGLGSDQTITFRALVTDPDPGDVISLEVEVQDVGAAFGGVGTLGVAVSSGSTASVSVTRQAPLLGQNDYYWRVRACDQASQCGAWVSFGGTSGDSPPRVTDFHVP